LKTICKVSISFFILFLYSFLSFSQAYQFKNYSIDNGISQPYVYTINQDKNGYLWTGTGEGLCKFDGLRFKSFYSKDGLAENFVTSSFKDRSRNLWLGHYQGGITFYNGKKFKAINTAGFSKSPVTCIIDDNKGYVWCATQNDGIFRISKNFEVDVFKLEFNQENIFSINFTKDNQLLVGTGVGIMVYELLGEKRKPNYLFTIATIPETKIQFITKKKNSGSFWIGTEDEGLFLLTPSSKKNQPFKADKIGKNLPVDIINVQDIYEDAQSNLWLATFGNGIIKLIISKTDLQYFDFKRFSDDNGLGNKYTKSIYCDHENNIWVGTYGTGLVQLTDNCFTFYSPSSLNYSNNIFSISIGPVNKWLGTENGLLKINMKTKEVWTMFNKKNGFVDDKITALFRQDSIHLIVGTDNNGVYRLDIPTNKFEKIHLNSDLLSSSVTSITGRDKTLWIATKNGIFKLEEDKEILTHFNTETGLPHNNINQIYLDDDNLLWVATKSNLISSINLRGEVSYKKVYEGTDLINVTGFLKDKKNNMWLSTFGNGVFKIHGNDIERYTSENGLRSNYCYSIIEDGSNNIWIGHRLGLSRIKTEKNSVDLFDKNDGITGDCNYNAFTKDTDGNVWFGTTNGAIKFDPHKDKINLIPPIINITSFKLNDKEIDFVKDTTLPYDSYRIRIDFIGISFKANTRVVYQYKLEGYDPQWSDKSYTNFAQYGKLSEGEYTFLLKAYNNDGVGSQVPLSIRIVIEPPFWKRVWFIILCIVGVLYGFYFIVKVRDRNHRRFQAQLQKALNEKTREVTFQKEEIEKKNKDITDSIRYAKRIQDALLPKIKKLNALFPESYIFFQPRDIVSGDFYFYEKYGDKVVIACADATGHGVPGAFMSMIGSTLLKDITSRKGVSSPAFALALLDEEIKMMLKQNDDDGNEQTQDGVDVVICEIDIVTHFVRICSTKRPVFIVNNNELKLLKKESSESQSYETIDIQLQKGDSIYMFTDGYPDQFGGENGKKIKTSNMKLMLEQIHALPIEKQEMIVDHHFNRWMEGYEQVDDVLFIGIRL